MSSTTWSTPRRPAGPDTTDAPDGSAATRHRQDGDVGRGHTTIADRVIEAMAARIADEDPDVGGAARRVLGLPLTGQDAGHGPRVEARSAGDIVSLRVRLSVSYPAPVQAVTERVRRRLMQRVTALAGKKVAMVDIQVVALHRPALPTRVIR